MTTWNAITIAGIALVAGGLAILVVFRGILWRNGGRRPAENETADHSTRSGGGTEDDMPSLFSAADRSADGVGDFFGDVGPLAGAAVPSTVPQPRGSRRSLRRGAMAEVRAGGLEGYDPIPIGPVPYGLASLGLADELIDEHGEPASPVPTGHEDASLTSTALTAPPLGSAVPGSAVLGSAGLPPRAAELEATELEASTAAAIKAAVLRASGPPPAGLAREGSTPGGLASAATPDPTGYDQAEFEPALHDFAHLGSVGLGCATGAPADDFDEVVPAPISAPSAYPAVDNATAIFPATGTATVGPAGLAEAGESAAARQRAARPTRYPYGDRVDGWVRPEYRTRAVDPVPAGEYWMPVSEPYAEPVDDRAGDGYPTAPALRLRPASPMAPSGPVSPMAPSVPPPASYAAAAFEAARDAPPTGYPPAPELPGAPAGDTRYAQPVPQYERDPYEQSPYDRGSRDREHYHRARDERVRYERARYEAARAAGAAQQQSGPYAPEWPPASTPVDRPGAWLPPDESTPVERTRWAERRGYVTDPNEGAPDADRSGWYFPRRRRAAAVRRAVRADAVPSPEQPGRARVTHPRAETRRQPAAATEFIPVISDATQFLPAVPLHGGYTGPEPIRLDTGRPRDQEPTGRPRPRPRPRSGGSQQGDERHPSRSTVYVSRHAAEPS